MASLPTNAVVLPKPKHTMLPVLVVLFLVSYGLMCMLVVEQGSTIDSQRFLIRQLLGDSSQLSHLKGKAFQQQHAQAQAQAKAQAQSNAHSQTQTPSTQVNPRENTKSERNAGKARRAAPQKPPKDTSDTVDERRMLISI